MTTRRRPKIPRPTITVTRLDDPLAAQPEWFADLRFCDTSPESSHRFGGEAALYGPTRPTRRAAQADAARLRAWWKSRPQ